MESMSPTLPCATWLHITCEEHGVEVSLLCLDILENLKLFTLPTIFQHSQQSRFHLPRKYPGSTLVTVMTCFLQTS